MTKRGDLDKVLKEIFATKAAGMAPLKLNAVIDGGNDDDILPLASGSPAPTALPCVPSVHGCRQLEQLNSAKLVAKKQIIKTIHARYPLRKSAATRAARHRRTDSSTARAISA